MNRQILMKNWISCRDRLPETGGDVLVFDGEDMFVAWYIGEWYSFSSQFDPDTPILAWMPLPEPPSTMNIDIERRLRNEEDANLEK